MGINKYMISFSMEQVIWVYIFNMKLVDKHQWINKTTIMFIDFTKFGIYSLII